MATSAISGRYAQNLTGLWMRRGKNEFPRRRLKEPIKLGETEKESSGFIACGEIEFRPCRLKKDECSRRWLEGD